MGSIPLFTINQRHKAMFSRFDRFPITLVAAIAAACGLCTPSRAGSITFNPNVHATLAAGPSSDGKGTLSALMASPGTNGPTLTDINGVNSGGFRYTDVLLRYTSNALDVGNTVTIDAWRITRDFSNTKGQFTTFISFDGNLTVTDPTAAGWSVNIGAVTAWQSDRNTGAIASVTGLVNNGNFAQSSYFSITGMNNNKKPDFFTSRFDENNNSLIQTMAMVVRPKAANQVFQFNFPGSVISTSFALPEPPSAIPAWTAILAGLGVAWRRRRGG
jgi:hypothetical protein